MFMYGLYAIESRKWDLQKNSVEIEPVDDEYDLKDDDNESRKYARSKSYSISCSSNVFVQGYNCKILYQKRNSQINNKNLINNSISIETKYEKNLKNFESYIAQVRLKSEIEKLQKSNFVSKQRRYTSYISNIDKILIREKNIDIGQANHQKQHHQSIKERQQGNNYSNSKISGKDVLLRHKSFNEKIMNTSMSSKKIDGHMSGHFASKEENGGDMMMPMMPAQHKSKSKKFLKSMFSKFKSYSLNE